MKEAQNPKVKALESISDPVERAIACQRFIDNGRATLQAVQCARDAAIRVARESRHPGADTVDRLASTVGVRRNVVVDALRRAGRK